MTAPFSGGCACGSIRFVCSRAPVATLNCHCLDCQRSSGAPFASGFIVRVSDVAITGTPKTYSVRAGSGRLAWAAFVPIAALLCSRVARLLQKLCPSVSLRWTIRRSFSRCWISGHLVHNHGFALVRRFLTILSCPGSLVADSATVRFRGIYPSAACGHSWPTNRGRKRRSPSPPSEPGVQFSSDGLSSQLFPHRD